MFHKQYNNWFLETFFVNKFLAFSGNEASCFLQIQGMPWKIVYEI